MFSRDLSLDVSVSDLELQLEGLYFGLAMLDYIKCLKVVVMQKSTYKIRQCLSWCQ